MKAYDTVTSQYISENVRPPRDRCRSAGDAGGQKMADAPPQRQCDSQVQICERDEKRRDGEGGIQDNYQGGWREAGQSFGSILCSSNRQ